MITVLQSSNATGWLMGLEKYQNKVGHDAPPVKGVESIRPSDYS